jgi:hypothetical protein
MEKLHRRFGKRLASSIIIDDAFLTLLFIQNKEKIRPSFQVVAEEKRERG